MGVGRTKVLAVEATPLISMGLHALFARTRDLTPCGITSSVAAAVAVVRETRPDVVLLDSSLDATADGARAMIDAQPAVGIIAFVRGSAGARSYVDAARRHGVRGLLPRSATPTQIITAIHAVRAGGKVVDRGLHPLLADPAGAGVSDRQRAVLELIALGHSNSAIADRLGVSTETIRTHVKALLVRLAAHDRAHAVARGYQQGILVATPGE